MLIVTLATSHEAAVEDLDFIFLVVAFLTHIVRFASTVAGIMAVRMALAVVEDVIIAIVQTSSLR